MPSNNADIENQGPTPGRAPTDNTDHDPPAKGTASATDIVNGDTAVFPPGTVRLQDTNSEGRQCIILQPQPTRDPNDPLNWPRWRKYLNFGLASFYVLMVSEFVNSATPTWAPMRTELGFSNAVLNDSYAVGCACLGLGALVLVPFALKFGRRPLYLVSTIVQCAVSVWSAKIQTVADLMLVNIICTLFGALAEVIVQMTVADVFFVHQRGKMNSIYVWFWQVSVSIGPLIAGFITQGQGWRWVWWWNAVFFGICSVLVGFAYEETKYCPPPVLRDQNLGSALNMAPGSDTKGLTHQHRQSDAELKDDINKDVTSIGQDRDTLPDATDQKHSATINMHRVEIDFSIPQKSYWQRLSLTTTSSSTEGSLDFMRHMYQPLVMLATVPAIAYTALVYGILIGLQDVMSTSFSLYMTEPPYSFNPAQIGLMNLPKLIGVTLGSLIAGPASDTLILWATRRNNGIYEPETRLWCIIPFIPFVIGGACMFGIGLHNGLPWPVIAVGLTMIKFGIAPINSLTVTYLTDSYQDIIGDALVGVTVVRNMFSTAFIFAVTPWVEAIGIQWVIISIVLIASAILALSGVFIFRGKRFRSMTAQRYYRYAKLQYKER